MLFTTISSTYASRFLPNWSLNTVEVIRANMDPALRRPSTIHMHEAVCAERGYKAHFFLVFGCHPNLVVAGEAVKEA